MFAAVPAFAFVAPNTLTATFQVNASAMLGTETLTATLGASMATGMILVKPLSGLVVNEVDYNNAGLDLKEYVELYNGTGAPYDLAKHALVLVNGADSKEYKRYDLSSLGVLPAGAYVVLGSDAALATVPGGVKTVSFGASKDYVQNGAPDAVGILDVANGKLVDALSYEGSVTMAKLTGIVNPVSFVEGTALDGLVVFDPPDIDAALCRSSKSGDTNDASKDWKVCKTLTPGAANAP
ncbi:MAG: lamin tail domain-containing protein [Deltaproteobacteria bacterium]|nr:lamin tail domain-containing protein [Deltaproteobacteria bacterium]